LKKQGQILRKNKKNFTFKTICTPCE